MMPTFDALVADAHRMDLKIGPIAERPDRTWRVYVQRGKEVFACREGATIEAAFEAVLIAVQAEEAGRSLERAAPSEMFE